MGILDTEPRFADGSAAPIFSITTVQYEHIGDGSVMLTAYFPVRGVLIPQYHSIMSCRNMIQNGTGAVLKAQNVLMEIGVATSGLH